MLEATVVAPGFDGMARVLCGQHRDAERVETDERSKFGGLRVFGDGGGRRVQAMIALQVGFARAIEVKLLLVELM